jgi:hypothetical protein
LVTCEEGQKGQKKSNILSYAIAIGLQSFSSIEEGKPWKIVFSASCSEFCLWLFWLDVVAAEGEVVRGGIGGTTDPATPATLVSIEVSPVNPSIALGTATQLKAIGIYSDNTKKDLTSSVTWSSSATAVADISNATGSNGLATSGTTPGSATIKATSGTVFGSTTLTVTSATLVSVEVTPTNPSIALGRSQQCTATGIFTDNTVQDLTTQAAWSSSDPAKATIGASDGLALSAGVGPATITASFGGKSGSTVLTVTNAVLQDIDITPAIPTVALGTSQQFTATGTYSDNTTEDLTATVSWSSDNTAVATVSSGLANSVGTGWHDHATLMAFGQHRSYGGFLATLVSLMLHLPIQAPRWGCPSSSRRVGIFRMEVRRI